MMSRQKPPAHLTANNVPVIDPRTGIMTPAWRSFFDDLTSAAPPIDDDIVLDASPATYTAIHAGALLVVGGTVSQIDFIRGRITVTTGLIAGFIPMSQNDQVEITYAVLPTVYYFPNGNPT